MQSGLLLSLSDESSSLVAPANCKFATCIIYTVYMLRDGERGSICTSRYVCSTCCVREHGTAHCLNAVAFHKFQREEAFLVHEREGTIFCAALFESVLREDPSPRQPSKAFLVARYFLFAVLIIVGISKHRCKVALPPWKFC